MYRKRRTRQHVIEEMGVNFLERQVLRRAHQLQRPTDPPKEHVVYRHEKEGTILKFPSREARPCLQGELLSLRVHLVGRGHIDEDAIDTFVETGRVPSTIAP